VRGYIRLVKASDQSFYGYVAEGNGAYGSGAVTTDIAQALDTSLSGIVFTTGGSLIDLPIINAQTYGFIGGTQLDNSGNGDLAAGSANYVTVANVDQTPPGQQVDSDNSYGNGITESAIWNYNSVTTAITATWTNSNGSPVQIPTILGLQASSYFYLTPDPAAFTASYGSFDTLNAFFQPAA